jgi:regulatory subunit for Cdc7p protein kinase
LQHIASKKHRRFAENPDNFHELDTLLMELRRPPHPALQEEVHKLFPACHEKHGAWSDCQLCQPRYGWEEESGSGSGSGSGSEEGTGSEEGAGNEESEGSEQSGSGSGTSEEGSDDDEE